MSNPMSHEVKHALAKAEKNARLAAQAKTEKDRDYYERMRRKWLGIAEGWRVIDEIDQVNE
jgi:thymidylate kinase